MALSTEDQLELGVQGKLLLKDVEVETFTASPPEIRPFEESTISWQVSGVNDDRIRLSLNATPVAPTGSTGVRPLVTSRYVLQARALSAVKNLGSQVVTVNTDNCQPQSILDAWVETRIRQIVRDLIQTGEGVELRDEVSVSVAAAPDNIMLRIPLKVDVPNWFDANVDVALRINVSAQEGRPRATLYEIGLDVSWSFWEHAASLFATSIVQSAVQAVMKRLLGAFLKPSIERQFAQGLEEAVSLFCPPAEGLVLHSMWLADGAIDFLCCPSSTSASPRPIEGVPVAANSSFRR